ncbi:DsbA family protein [Streptosporangium sp. NBC_01755]|uniref:2-hydroxychromene-2-carboxylate isomerase n=1 Tax=unclassified Streptosporangium TaxID=2632669 RepID=UPI002DD8E76C|nr:MULTISPECIES: DsbA family protein [unclassified Streptosporangium]WSA27997.1 DsbA family protein [Streptosporangium sp. NBC_01810]WSA28140.1 DsbA family protein [Streptosporangium sp. NBC_01810]WSD00385.1 DsbA family protein [Streptosporangium sp. NBC_01755]WSD00532.1 DsbA family protein [Streptosporangium sp. NBC_01755]
MAKPKRLKWYFSLRSPYSWIAYRDLLAHHPDVLAAVEWLPMWEPGEECSRLVAEQGIELPYTVMSKAKHLYILQDVRRLARARGLTMTWPVDKDPEWDVAHLGYLAALDEGKGEEFVAATYRARWENGLNISDPDVVAAVAKEIGLDPVRIAGAHEDPLMQARSVAYLKNIEKDGVFGVPMFMNGRDKFWGADRVLDFVASVRGTWAPQPEPIETVVPPAAAGDAGHAGGCG